MNDAQPLSATSPFTLVLFGASGNLAKLKLYPALAMLAKHERLPADYAIIGFARTEMDDDSFRALVRMSIDEANMNVDASVIEQFLTHVFYHRGGYDDEASFTSLQERLKKLEKGWKHPVRLAYLSIPPTAYVSVVTLLCSTGIRTGAFRCIVEKPVGHDLESFEAIRTALTSCFDEKEVFLLDHYLGKESVRTVYYLRHANPVLERLFSNAVMQSVEINASESRGIEGRAGYFEAAGMLRDFVQNHILLMGALLTMDLQETEDGFRESRAAALARFSLPHGQKPADAVLQGQYDGGIVNGEPVVGYTHEEGVAPDSRTNTFIALTLHSHTPRFEGVPFFIRTGKRLKKRETGISVEFKEAFQAKGNIPNRLDIILQGEPGMKFHLQTKVGGSEPTFRPLLIEDPLTVTGDVLPDHGLLLLEAMNGKQQWFLSFDEVRSAWKLIDPIQQHLDSPKTPLVRYPAGIALPHEATEWIAKHGAEWYV